MKLYVKLKNCFGIGEFDDSFDLTKDNTIMIYAPNGTMKTSLARTFLCLENNHNAADLLDDTKESTYSIMLDGNIVTHDQVYVYKTEDNQIEQNGISQIEEDNIKSFISSPKEVAKFWDILKPIEMVLRDIDSQFGKLVNQGKIFFHEETLKLYKFEGILSTYDSISKAITESMAFDSSKCDFSGFSYDELFDEHGTSVKYIHDHYNELIININLRNKVKVDPHGQKRWERLCEIVDNNSYVKSKIGDLESLRKEYILNFIHNESKIMTEFNSLYFNKKSKLQEIIKKVNRDNRLWNQVLSVYKNRFNVPFQLQLDNKAEAILVHDFLRIKYLNSSSRKTIEYKSKEHFLNFISTGEKRAYYNLINLFEIEKRKNSNKSQIIVIDDIAESFDYKNKYAIVEYLAELRRQDNFILIILTHNFDFYRTVQSRLDVKNIFIASKDKNRCITLKNGKYVKDIIKNELIRNAHITKYMIALIPFVRNIVEYTKGGDSSEYKLLTAYLHMQNTTKSLTLESLYKTICSNIAVGEMSKENISAGNYFNELIKLANNILSSNDDISITNKLVLSIAIRLTAEDFIYNSLPKEVLNNIENNKDFTFFLFDEYKSFFRQKGNNCSVLTKVLMMTSENIHLNNFMFEPIIDLSLEYLKKLFNEVKTLR